MPESISVSVDLDLESLADSLAWQVTQEDLIDFMVALDEQVADYDFTRTLAKKFKKIIKAENKAAKKAQKERLGW